MNVYRCLARSIGIALAAVIVGTSFAPAAQAASPAASPAASQKYYWEWSDDVEDSDRWFPKEAYTSAKALPKVVVMADPATPARKVVLQYKQDGKWQREDVRTTDADGIARLSLNPICRNGKWCDATFKYRFVVNGRVAYFSVDYASK